MHHWSRCLWIVCHEAVECLRPSPRDCCVRAVKGSGWSLGVPRRSRCRPRWILCARTHVQEHEVCIPAMHPSHLALCQATTAPTPPCLVSCHHCTHPTLPCVRPPLHPPHLASCRATTAPTPPCLVSGHHCTHPTLPCVVPPLHPPHLASCRATTAPTPPCLVSGHHCTHPTLPRVSVKYTADMPYYVDSQCACIRNSKYILLLMKAHIPKPPEISVD